VKKKKEGDRRQQRERRNTLEIEYRTQRQRKQVRNKK
jgi:hypothetical protein